MKPTFGTVGMEIHELTEQCTYVERAIHTLEHLRDNDVIKDDGSISAGFASQSHAELIKLRDWFYSQGVKPRDVDLGAFV